MIAWVATAFAWDHTNRVVVELPHEVQLDPDPAPGMTPEDTLAAIDAAVATWNAVECVSQPLVAVLPQPHDEPGFTVDGVSRLGMSDPDGELARSDLAAVSVMYGSGQLFLRYGELYITLDDADTVIDDARAWATDAVAGSGACADQHSLQAVMTRHLGYHLGLAASGVPGATMTGPDEPCDVAPSTLEDDDKAGIQALYGPSFEVTCTTDGGDATCEPTGIVGGEIAAIHWSWGDGATGTEPAHTYTDSGSFFVTACATWTDPTCAEQCIPSVMVLVSLRDPIEPPGDTGGTPASDQTDPDVEREDSGGCGCAAVAPGQGAGSLILLAWAVRRRRRAP